MDQGFGIDFGGSGIKGAPVDLELGEFAAERVRIKTPEKSTPEAVAEVFADLVDQFPDSTGPVGVTVPGVVRNGVVHSAANIDKSWIGTDADALFTGSIQREVHVVNDADAAGLAEVRYGAARGQGGLVIMTTLGTGIGSAFLYDGALVPNSELGHLEISGRVAEKWAANSARENEDLSWQDWAEPADDVLPRARGPVLPRAVRRRRWDQQEVGGVPAPARDRNPDRAGCTAQPRRHRRRGAVRPARLNYVES